MFDIGVNVEVLSLLSRCRYLLGKRIEALRELQTIQSRCLPLLAFNSTQRFLTQHVSVSVCNMVIARYRSRCRVA